MKHIYSVLSLLILGATLSIASAQAVSLPYQMSFEDNESAELANWTLNPGANAAILPDQWFVGNSVHSVGRQALYISNDSADAMFDTVPCVQYAYRDMILPQGTYILSFEWLCIGSDNSSLYVGMGDFSSLTLEARTNGILPNTLTNPVLSAMIPACKDLKKQETWQNVTYTSSSDGVTPTRLVFAWVTKNKDRSKCSIGACIDNIVITNANCKRPTDISTQVISCDSALVSWKGLSGSYEVAYREVGTTNWLIAGRAIPDPNDYSKFSTYLTNLSEGNFEVRVRSICTPDTSAWAYGDEFVLFCPDLHCVNFTDLTAPTVTCTYGTTRSSYADPSDRAHAYDNVGIVDFGSESILSRHTVNWDKTATDPRTGNNLPLIPKNGYASVRLGNWEDGNGAESITYEYVVDSSNAVVLMQYAVVLQDPDGHGDDSPRFLLEILDENNNLIEPTCGKRNFVATYVDRNEWRSFTPTTNNYYNEPVLYKPWTTVGLNLRELGVTDGQIIRVRLTTFDCFWSAHYGYAYFTLDCAKATIESASCAKDDNVGMTLVAPDGFKYQWYDKFGAAIANATSRIYTPIDTATYRCRLTSTENADCYFDLYSACVPRLPKPRFSYTRIPQNCQNKVQFNNESYVRIIQQNDTIEAYNERPQSYLWVTEGIQSDGTAFIALQSGAENPEFIYPAQGGHFKVSLTALLNGGCEEAIEQEFDIPDIRIASTTIDRHICRPANATTQDVWMPELKQFISASGVYPVTLTAANGCDSVVNYNVTIGDDYLIHLGDTTLCYGETLQVGDTIYDTRLKNDQIWDDYLVSSQGCDSIIYYNVTVLPEIKPTITCGDSTLAMPFAVVVLNPGESTVNLNISGTGFDSYILSYTDINGDHKDVHGATDPLNNLPINRYKFTFSNYFGCSDSTVVLIGGDTLCVDLHSQIQCDCEATGKPSFWIPFQKCQPENDALVRSCRVVFDPADIVAQGFADVAITDLKKQDTLKIAVPNGAEPGIYPVDIIFDDAVGGVLWGQNAFHTQLVLTYDSSIIFHRWASDAIISLKNANYARKADGQPFANYAFSDFQWIHNGLDVIDANKSYLQHNGALLPSDDYQLRFTRADGITFTTCHYRPSAVAPAPALRGQDNADVVVAPLSPAASEPISISVSELANIELYSVLGTHILSAELQKGNNSIIAPAASGLYILNVHTRGEKHTFRLQVR